MSRKALRLGNGALRALERDFNSMIVNTIAGMETRNSDEATITAKLSIIFSKENYITADGNVETVIMPKLEHKITSAIQIKEKVNGQLSDVGTLEWDPERREYTVDVGDEQLTIDVERDDEG